MILSPFQELDAGYARACGLRHGESSAKLSACSRKKKPPKSAESRSRCQHSSLILRSRRFTNILSAEPKRNDSENSKRAINQSPAERDSANASHHQRKRHYQHTGNHSELNHPNVFYRVSQSILP